MEVREKHGLWVNVAVGELRGQICARLLPVRHAVDPIEQLHSLGVIAIRWMFREGVVEAAVDQEVSETRMVYPMYQRCEIARNMIAVGLLGACGVEVQTSVHMDNAGPKGSDGNVTRMLQYIVQVREC